MIVLQPILQELTAQAICIIQPSLIRRLDQISPTCLQHGDDYASTVQSSVIWQLCAANNFGAEGLKRTAPAESYRSTRCSSLQEVKKFTFVAGGKGLIYEEGWIQLFVYLVKCGGSNVRC